MAKKKAKNANRDNGEGDDARKTVQVMPETHELLRRYCGRALKIQTVVDSAMRWMLENDAVLLDAVVNRERIGSEGVRQMYCSALRALVADVCQDAPEMKDLAVNRRDQPASCPL